MTSPEVQLENLRERIEAAEDITDDDQDALLAFDDAMTLLNSNYSAYRHVKLLRHVTIVAERVGGIHATLTDRTLDHLEALEGEEQADALEDLLNTYVEASPENGLEDPFRDVQAWVEKRAKHMDPDERRRVMNTLDRLETATDASGAGAAD